MRRSTLWMIKANYHASLLVGIISFCRNQNTGEIYTSPIVTAYSALVSIGLFAIVYVLFFIDFSSPYLYVKINGLIFVVRVMSILLTAVCNWTKRRELMVLISDLSATRHTILQRWPMSEKLKRKFENTLRRKFYWSYLAMITLFLGLFEYLKMQFDMPIVFVIMALAVMTTVLNVVMMNYFILMSHLNILLMLINEELVKILNVSYILRYLQNLQLIRPRFLREQCGLMANDLHDLAMTQHRLHLLGNRINCIYEIHGACIILMEYLNNVSMFHIVYTSWHNSQQILEQFSIWSMILAPIFLLIHYIDLYFFMWGIMDFQKSFTTTGELLKERELAMPPLDGRLEES
uniref:Gustatory receptor n=1 Tax=Stomoxys calcitrans TaxID=35570 RepID=A0A454A0P3_STOCA